MTILSVTSDVGGLNVRLLEVPPLRRIEKTNALTSSVSIVMYSKKTSSASPNLENLKTYKN